MKSRKINAAGRGGKKEGKMRFGLAVTLGTLLLATGCQTTSEKTVKKTSEPTSQSERLAKLAKDIEGRGEADTALPLYARAAAMPEASAAIMVQSGDAYSRAGQPEEAISAYKAALAKSPDNGPALLGMGTALVQIGDLSAGVSALTSAAPVVGTSSAYNRLGVALTMTGQTQSAIAAYQKALSMAPADVDIQSNLALAAALQGDASVVEQAAHTVEASGAAELHHKRNIVLAYGLIGHDQEVRSSTPAGLTSGEVDKILKLAKKARTKGSVTAKAAALHDIMSG
ncbi:tetratricopeptide repeat protein [Brucella sp. LJL56]